MNPEIGAEAVEAALAEQFTVRKSLGSGAQGLVLHAVRHDGRHVALKVYFGAVETERVQREVAALERTRHTCLASVVEHGRVDVAGHDLQYVAWEFIDGETLRARLREEKGGLSVGLVASVGRDVARAIQEIWRDRIVHRDIKPENVMLRVEGEAAVLIDLGVARHLSEPSLTAYGQSLGTMGYLSPEQCRAVRALTCKSDVFSLGVVLLEALTGTHPTGGDQRRLVQEEVDVADLVPAAPAELVGLVGRMLDHREAFRPLPAEVEQVLSDYVE